MKRLRGLSLIFFGVSVQNRSGSGPQQLVSTEILAGERVVNGEKGVEKERLLLFGNSIFFDVFYAILAYTAPSGKNDIVEMSIIQLVRVDAWVANVLTCLEHREKNCRNRQNVYEDIFTSHVSAALNRLNEQIHRLVKIRGPEEPERQSEVTGSDSRADVAQKGLLQLWRATRVSFIHSINCMFISIEREWSTDYGGDLIRPTHDRYIAEVTKEL